MGTVATLFAFPLFFQRLFALESHNFNTIKPHLIAQRTKYKRRGDRAFAVVAPKRWNSLPSHIRVAPTLNIFKRRLKAHFLCLAFETAVC